MLLMAKVNFEARSVKQGGKNYKNQLVSSKLTSCLQIKTECLVCEWKNHLASECLYKITVATNAVRKDICHLNVTD